MSTKWNATIGRSSHRCSIKKVVLKNHAKSIGKHLCQSLAFNKVASVRPATLLKGRLWHSEFREIFKNSFFTEHFWATGFE